MTATRTPLPARRPNLTRDVEWDGRRFTLTVGYDLDGRPREVFADGEREGSMLQAILADACVIVSIALQCGIEPAALGRSLGTVPVWHVDGEAEAPASPIGTIVGALETLNADLIPENA